MTITSLKAQNNSVIRTKTLPGSILTTQDAALRDLVVDELKSRGVITSANTAALATIPSTESDKVYIPGDGFYYLFATGTPPDGVVTYPSATAGYVWTRDLTKLLSIGGAVSLLDSTIQAIKSLVALNGIIITPGGSTVSIGMEPMNVNDLDADVSLSAGDSGIGSFFLVDATTENIDITLDADAPIGTLWIFKKTDATTNSVNFTTKEGAQSITDQNGYIWIMFNGTEWEIVNNSSAGGGPIDVSPQATFGINASGVLPAPVSPSFMRTCFVDAISGVKNFTLPASNSGDIITVIKGDGSTNSVNVTWVAGVYGIGTPQSGASFQYFGGFWSLIGVF